MCAKVAPGMEAQFTIIFKPLACVDYSCDIKFYTDRESFTVPVRALGARPQLLVPEVVNFGLSCPCNSITTKSLLVRNVGRCSGHFQLSATAPYSVVPTVAVLEVGETVHCSLQLKPRKTGSASGMLIAAAACGVEQKIKLVGAAVNADVFVSPTAVSFLDTFVTKCTQRTFRVFNKSVQPLRFSLHRSSNSILPQCTGGAGGRPTGAGTDAQPRLIVSPTFGTPEMTASPMYGMVLPQSYVEVSYWSHRSHQYSFLTSYVGLNISK